MPRQLYKTGTISRLTGFSSALLRTWEQRYGILSPRRQPGGHRLYSEDDLAILLRIRVLLGEGKAIGEIVLSGRKQLLAETQPSKPTSAPVRAIAHLAAKLDVTQLLDLVVEVAAEDLHAALARVWTIDRDPKILHLRASAGLTRRVAGSSREHINIDVYPYRVGVVARTRTPFFQSGLVGDAHFEQDWVKRERLESVAALPLLGAGDLLGVMICFFRHRLDDEVVEEIKIFGSAVADALAAKRQAPARRRRGAA